MKPGGGGSSSGDDGLLQTADHRKTPVSAQVSCESPDTAQIAGEEARRFRSRQPESESRQNKTESAVDKRPSS